MIGEAEWTGLSLNQALRWRRDGQLYACSPLITRILGEVGFPRRSVAGPQFWVTEDGHSLAALAFEIEPRRGDSDGGNRSAHP
jgi:hypothetical protein